MNLQQLEHAFAASEVLEWFDIQISQLGAKQRELQRHKSQFCESTGSAEIVSWAINSVENYVRNINFAHAARVYSDIKVAETKENK